MNDWSDQQLLREYAERRSEQAFSELVRRYVNLVYSSAKRMVCDAHLAEDVTQAVFCALARSASQLADRSVLSSWLHRTTHNLAAQTVRSDVRRRVREQEAAAMNESPAGESDTPWDEVAQHLDDAMQELSEADRAALLLRYFEHKSAREMAERLGTREDTAQRRLNRAVERLRHLLTKRGVAVSAGGLAVALGANGVQAAPVGLAATVMSGVAASFTASAITTAKIITMTTLQKICIAAALTAAMGAAIYQAGQASGLRKQNQLLQDQQLALSDQAQRLQREREGLTNRLALIASKLAKMENSSNQMELLKLRGEIGRLSTAASSSSVEPSIKNLAANIAFLKKKLEEMPDKKIPEIQFATEKDWIDAAWNADLSTEDGVRQALSTLRGHAINKFLNEMMQGAFKKYLAEHDNILPGDLYQLKPYFDVPVTDAMLAQYKLLQGGKINPSADLVTLQGHADPDYDSNHGMSLNGAWGGEFNRVRDAVGEAGGKHLLATGQVPTEPSQILPYLDKTVDPATIQKYLDGVASKPLPLEFAVLRPAMQAFAGDHNGRMPDEPQDLEPYLTTPDQKAAFQKAIEQYSNSTENRTKTGK